MTRILYFPSFYLAFFFTASFILFEVRLFPFPSTHPLLYFFLLFINLCAFLSCLVNWKGIRGQDANFLNFVVNCKHKTPKLTGPFILFLIGISGIFLHISMLLREFGGVSGFILVLATSAHEVRVFNGDLGFSLGIQIGYFSWVAMSAVSFQFFFRSGTAGANAILILMALGILIVNLVFIDRTRPIWLVWNFVHAGLLMLLFGGRTRTVQVVSIGFPIFVITVFVMVGLWIGKVEIGRASATGLPQWFESIYTYLTGGIAYLNYLLSGFYDVGINFGRVIYPVAMFLNKLGLTASPESQILPHHDVGGFETNAATFVEPFLSDGGVLFVVIGILIHTFIFDWLALACYRKLSTVSLLFASTLVFTNLIAFFVPKIVGVPFFMFAAFFFLESLLLNKRHEAKR